MALEITDANFQTEVMENDKVTLIDFWAAWCGPCRMIAPAIEELAEAFEGRATVGKINVDENPQVSAQFGVRSIPTLLFIKNGEVVDKQVGVAPKSVLAQKLEALIETPVE